MTVAPPTGVSSFLFTDVAGSTRLWESDREGMAASLELHDWILRHAIEENGGYVFSTAGDAFAAAFLTAGDAALAAIRAQLELLDTDWPGPPIWVRMGIHRGSANERGGDYFGPVLNRTARLMAIANGGQVLVSGDLAAQLGGRLPAACSLQDLGRHRLKDLEEAEHVFQIDYPGMSEFPPLRSLGSFANNLPLLVSSFVGRDRELAEVAAAIRAARLVTLVGPGGAGKTRLATHVAADLLDDFPAGVWFVDLSPLTEPKLVANAVAGAIGLEEAGGSLSSALVDALGRGHTLVVIDNCEHLVAAAASLVEELLSAVPELRILATSREGLEVPGESRYQVEPMSLPETAVASDLLALDAVRLFAARAAQVDPEFVVDADNVTTVAEICRHLDGIPLAIELAAARIRHLGLGDIADRLDDRFGLLTRGARTAALRQQTLRAAVDWSYELLDASQQACFRRLAVFAGAFRLESAESVAGFGVVEPPEVLDRLSGLVDRSLVRSESDHHGLRRFRLLETLRAYGTDRLAEAGEAQEAQQRHIANFLALAEAAKTGLRGPDSVEWHDRLAADLDDLRAVLQRTIGSGDLATAASIAVGCWFHWYVRGHWDEGYRWLARIEELGKDLELELRADVLRGLGGLATAMHRLDEGVDALEREIEIRTELGQRSPLAAAVLNLANAKALDARYAEAIELYGQSLAISREIGEEISSVMSNLAWTALDMGNYELAGRRFSETLELARVEGERRNEGWGHLGVGVVAWLQGDFAISLESLEAARSRFAEYQERPMVAFCRTFEAKAMRDRGDRDRAIALLRDLADELAALDDPTAVIRWLTTAAVIVSAQGRLEEAALLLGAVGDVAELPPWERVEIADVMVQLEQSLGTAPYRAARSAGEVADRIALMREAFST